MVNVFIAQVIAFTCFVVTPEGSEVVVEEGAWAAVSRGNLDPAVDQSLAYALALWLICAPCG